MKPGVSHVDSLAVVSAGYHATIASSILDGGVDYVFLSSFMRILLFIIPNSSLGNLMIISFYITKEYYV